MPDDPDVYRAARRAERERVEGIKVARRKSTDKRVREVLEQYFPDGAPAGLLIALQRTSQPLIDEIGRLEGVTRELHDGINRIADEASQRWVDGFNECRAAVAQRAAEVGLPREQIDILLKQGRG